MIAHTHTHVWSNQEARAGFDTDEWCEQGCSLSLSPPLSFSFPSSFLSVLQAQKKLSTASPFFPPFFKKAPKEPHQHSTWIPSSLHPITCDYHTECVCVCVDNVCVFDGGRQTETGRENPFVFPVNPQGHVQAFMNRSKTATKCEAEIILQVRVCGIRIFFFKSTLRLMEAKASPVQCASGWPDVCGLLI